MNSGVPLHPSNRQEPPLLTGMADAVLAEIAENLAAAMAKVNDEKNLARVSPPAATVAKWVDAAKKTDPRITY